MDIKQLIIICHSKYQFTTITICKSTDTFTPDFKLSFEKDEGKTYVIVDVLKGQQTPYYYAGRYRRRR